MRWHCQLLPGVLHHHGSLFIDWLAGIVYWVAGIVYWLAGIVYWMVGIVYWVTGIVYWVASIVYWVASIVYWVAGIVYWVAGIVYWLLWDLSLVSLHRLSVILTEQGDVQCEQDKLEVLIMPLISPRASKQPVRHTATPILPGLSSGSKKMRVVLNSTTRLLL